jgi:hypothetical protein
VSVGIDEVSLLEPQRDLVILFVGVKAINAGAAVDSLAVDPDGVETNDSRGGEIRRESAASTSCFA